MLSLDNLHEYQRKAVSFIKEKKRCGLFIDMGLGKTVSTLTAINDLIDSFAVKKVLVVAPLRVSKSVWPKEVKEWEHLQHLKVSVVTGSERERLAALHIQADIYSINRENIPWLVGGYRDKWPFDCVIVDESSSFKNSSSKRFKAIKKILPFTEYMVLLTGTPSPNGLIDLWSQVYMIDFGRSLGRTKTAYKEKYFDESFYGMKIKEGKEEQIHKQIEPFTLSMQVEDYLQLPPCINLTQEIYLPYDVMEQYQKFERELLLELPEDQEIEALNAAVLANKLLQFCSGAVYTDQAKNYAVLHDEKLNALEEIVDTNDEPVLVAYNFKSDLERLMKRFPFAVHLGKDEETIESWNRGEIKMLLAHPQSSGHGLNLQKGGSLCVWFSLCWSLENYMQLNKRLDRQGQTKPVRIIHLAVSGGIDERVLKVLSSKEKTQKALLLALKPKKL